jgi:hypothetical protein
MTRHTGLGVSAQRRADVAVRLTGSGEYEQLARYTFGILRISHIVAIFGILDIFNIAADEDVPSF